MNHFIIYYNINMERIESGDARCQIVNVANLLHEHYVSNPCSVDIPDSIKNRLNQMVSQGVLPSTILKGDPDMVRVIRRLYFFLHSRGMEMDCARDRVYLSGPYIIAHLYNSLRNTSVYVIGEQHVFSTGCYGLKESSTIINVSNLIRCIISRNKRTKVNLLIEDLTLLSYKAIMLRDTQQYRSAVPERAKMCPSLSLDTSPITNVLKSFNEFKTTANVIRTDDRYALLRHEAYIMVEDAFDKLSKIPHRQIVLDTDIMPVLNSISEWLSTIESYVYSILDIAPRVAYYTYTTNMLSTIIRQHVRMLLNRVYDRVFTVLVRLKNLTDDEYREYMNELRVDCAITAPGVIVDVNTVLGIYKSREQSTSTTRDDTSIKHPVKSSISKNYDDSSSALSKLKGSEVPRDQYPPHYINIALVGGDHASSVIDILTQVGFVVNFERSTSLDKPCIDISDMAW